MKNLKLILIVFNTLFITGINTFSQISLDWIRSYNPVSNHDQIANDVAIGDDGASYVLGYNGRGYNGGDIALVKYSPSGEFRWAKSYDGGNENSNDIGKSVTSFKSGNNIFIYAACEVSVSGYGNQAGVLKYDSSGNLLWSKIIPPGFNSTVTKIITDSSGNIYTAGGTSAEGFVIKLNHNGDTLWIKKIPNPSGAYNSVVTDITADNSGNIYGTGKIYSLTSYFDMITFKYNSAGVLQWSKIYNYGQFDDYGNALVLNSGFVYVTGGSDPSNWQDDIVLIKYNASTGDSVWVKRYNGVSSQYDVARDVTADAAGNIYITGQTDGVVYNGDIITIKYNPSGTLQWMRTYTGLPSMEDAGKEIEIDSDSNVYIAGRINFGNGAQFIGIKYNSNGDSLWTRLFDAGTIEEVYAMALDKNKNMVIAGECDNKDMAVIKYNSSGTLQWFRKFYGAQLIYDHANCVATDKNGNVYAAGKSRVSQYGDQFTVIKFTPSGSQAWIKNYGVQLYDSYDEAKAMVINDSGFIYVAGTSFSRFSNLTKDYLTFKLDTAGNQYWYATFNGIGNGDDDAKAISADNAGNVYVTGQSRGASMTDDYCTVKYNSSGVKLWQAYYNGPGNSGDYAYDVSADAAGNVFVTGQSIGSGTADDIATVKYNSNGILQWVQRFNGSANGSDFGNTIELDKGSNVYVCGMAKETSTGFNSILIKYTSNGVLRWSKQDSSNDSLNSVEAASSIKLDSTKTRIYLTGTWANNNDGRKAPFVAKYDSSGYRIYRSNVLFYMLASESYATGLSLDKNQNVYTSGYRVYSNGKPSEIILDAYDSSMSSYYGFQAGYSYASNGPDGKDVISVNDNGNIFIGGGIYDSTAGTLMSVIKYKQQPFEINLTLLIQGFYNSAANSMIPDTVKVYLRYPTSPHNVIDSARGILNSAGNGIFKFDNTFLRDGNVYYLEVRHRNSIETWASNWIIFSYGSLNYSFISSVNQAYGNNQILIDDSPVKYAIYGGDVNQDGYVDLTDITTVYNDANSFVSGYVNSDLTGNNLTDLTDLILAYNNSVNFVSVKKP